MQPIAHNIFTDEQPPHLLGGRERSTGKLVFPLPDGDDYDPVPLSREGTVWSYTIQRFRPKSPPYQGPEDFRPFPVAYIEIPGELIVEARLTNIENDDVEIGLPVRLTQIPLDPDREELGVIPAFEPVGHVS